MWRSFQNMFYRRKCFIGVCQFGARNMCYRRSNMRERLKKRICVLMSIALILAIVMGSGFYGMPRQEVIAAEKNTYTIQPSGDTTGARDRINFNKIAKEHYSEEKTIVFESGKTYYIDATLHLPNDTTVVATGATIRQVTKGKPIFITAYYEKVGDEFYKSKKPASSVGGYSRAKNITIDGGTYVDVTEPDPNASNGKYGNYKKGFSDFQFIHGENITVKNCTITNNYNGHFIELVAVNNAEIKNVKFNGTYIGDSTNEVVQIESAYNSSVAPSGAPFDSTPTKNVAIRDCTFEVKNSPIAIGTNPQYGKKFSNIYIYDNSISASIEAVSMNGVEGGCVIGNVVKSGKVNIDSKSKNIIYYAGATKFTRLYGTGRYDTMKAIVLEPERPLGGAAIVATGTGFKDALAASGLAGVLNAPLILTDGKSLSSQAKEVIQKLKIDKIYIAGGEFAISKSVENELAKLVKNNIVRCAGANSAATSAELAKKGKGSWSGDNTAIIATNKSFKDALSVSPIAYAKKYPILLADNGQSLSGAVLDTLTDLGIKNAIIVGGELAVTPKVVSQLESKGIKVRERLSGGNALQTSEAIAKWGLKNGLTANRMGVATSQNYPDALAGAALCGYYKSVLVLADDKATYNTAFPKSYKTIVKKGYVFGGEFAVGADTFKALENNSK